jgi:hypothetical protein
MLWVKKCHIKVNKQKGSHNAGTTNTGILRNASVII